MNLVCVWKVKLGGLETIDIDWRLLAWVWSQVWGIEIFWYCYASCCINFESEKVKNVSKRKEKKGRKKKKEKKSKKKEVQRIRVKLKSGRNWKGRSENVDKEENWWMWLEMHELEKYSITF